jgi:hypothetical protein
MNFFMPVVNWIKVGAICGTDLINKVYDPFELPPAYDPISYPATLEPLFYADLEARFMQSSGEFFYQIPRPTDAGDTALFQGLVTGMKILKGADVTKQVDFLKQLFLNGTLIRGYYADQIGDPNDTTSNDSATGMLFFFYVALRWGSDDVRGKAGALLRTWVNNLRAHAWALVNLHGNPTKYGQLEDGIKTDPLRMTLLLAILSVAMAYDPSFNQDYADLYNRYRPILAYPKVKLLWWDTDYDTHRAAIHLHVLYWMTKDEVYARGLRRIWRIVEKTQNAWVYTLCASAMEKPDGSFIRRALSTFDFNRRQLGTLESLNPDVPSVKWGSNVRCKYALPFYKRGSQEFFWQRSMFSKDEWVGNTWGGVYHSGLDFLICGWLANRLGYFQ